MRKSWRLSKVGRIVYAFMSVCSRAFWEEVVSSRVVRFHFAAIIELAKTASLSLAVRDIISLLLRQHYRSNGTKPLIYSYWFDYMAYGAALAKGGRFPFTLVTRAHGYDVYSERRKLAYMPLKRRLGVYVDHIYPISLMTKEYLAQRYGFPAQAMTVARLGVPLKTRQTPTSPANEIRIVSCSSCVRIKRLDRIIRAVRHIAQLNPKVDVYWTHIGGGQLFDRTRALASANLDTYGNAHYCLTGQISHEDVERVYTSSVFDVFVNCSESEGAPVSIIEAMSHGIPVVAPRVGAIPDLVPDGAGLTLETPYTSRELARSIVTVAASKDTKSRVRATEHVRKHYLDGRNYSLFVDHLAGLLAQRANNAVEG